jgi:hypothetical protein
MYWQVEVHVWEEHPGANGEVIEATTRAEVGEIVD